MNVTVLLASGTQDEWESPFLTAKMSMEMGGALLVVEGDDDEEELLAIYAPGMWMKAEFSGGS